jgi:hypothetical protein
MFARAQEVHRRYGRVESIDAGQGKISVKFDETAIDEETVSRITKDSIEKLGYRVDE